MVLVVSLFRRFHCIAPTFLSSTDYVTLKNMYNYNDGLQVLGFQNSDLYMKFSIIQDLDNRGSDTVRVDVLYFKTQMSLTVRCTSAVEKLCKKKP